MIELAVTRGGKTYYYHRDPQNSVVMITDEAGDVVNRYRYESFGGLALTCPSLDIGKPCIENRYTYTGRELLSVNVCKFFFSHKDLPEVSGW